MYPFKKNQKKTQLHSKKTLAPEWFLSAIGECVERDNFKWHDFTYNLYWISPHAHNHIFKYWSLGTKLIISVT